MKARFSNGKSGSATSHSCYPIQIWLPSGKELVCCIAFCMWAASEVTEISHLVTSAVCNWKLKLQVHKNSNKIWHKKYLTKSMAFCIFYCVLSWKILCLVCIAHMQQWRTAYWKRCNAKKKNWFSKNVLIIFYWNCVFIVFSSWLAPMSGSRIFNPEISGWEI